MRNYEMVMVISPEVEDENIPATIEKVTQWITEKGGSITQVESWGRRKLAYPVRRFEEGNYVVATFQGEPKLTEELEANLKISEEVLRYLLVRAGE